MPRRGLRDAIFEVVKVDREQSKDLIRRRVVGRNTDGTEKVQKITATCVERSGIDANEIGRVIELPATPPFRGRGVAGLAVPTNAPYGVMVITSMTPKYLTVGTTEDVTFAGRGLYDGMQLKFMEPDGLTESPWHVVNSITFVSSEEITVNVTTDSLAPIPFDPVTGDLLLLPVSYG